MNNIKKYYAGIGSRRTPVSLMTTIQNITLEMNKYNYVLRSGGAEGADTFFEQHAKQKEIYLPWKGFNNNSSDLHGVSEEALKMAEKYHPSWNSLSDGAKKLMARNCYQVLGKDLSKPVNLIICYTTDGMSSGGTGQALRIAESLNIPIFNLYYTDCVQNLMFFLETEKLEKNL